MQTCKGSSFFKLGTWNIVSSLNFFDSKRDTKTVVNEDMIKCRREGKWDSWWWKARTKGGKESQKTWHGDGWWGHLTSYVLFCFVFLCLFVWIYWVCRLCILCGWWVIYDLLATLKLPLCTAFFRPFTKLSAQSPLLPYHPKDKSQLFQI